ncbi:choline/ethanolamine kinase-like [Dermatophagoides pteronyssinus]|uniref:choline/ethanolamine kinase-like n=1 Tax=Dermatophagoides pteronyssinus TaxID=6956 RepID=UPI003F6798AA
MSSSVIDDEEKKVEDELFEKYKNLIPEELFRGTTPDDIGEQCFKLAKIYMANNNDWRRLCRTKDDLNIRRITGGLTNQLYYVGLKNHSDETNNAITIKFYQSKHFKKDDNDDERLNDTIISIIMSERGLGPKVFGIIPNGIIQSYHEHERFSPKYQQNDRLLRKLAHCLAQLNSLDIPIAKDKFNLLDIVINYIHDGYHRINVSSSAKELNLTGLLENDFLAEMDWFYSFMEQYDNQCPMVFCHNDFRSSNIMVLKDNEELLICDFEYGAYGFRGYDLATFLIEWDRNLFDFQNINLPSDDVLEKFIRFYLEGWDQIDPGYSTKAENSCQKIMNETKIGYFFCLVVFMGVTLNQKEAVIDNFEYDPKQICIGVNYMFKQYLNVKNSLIKEKIIQF